MTLADLRSAKRLSSEQALIRHAAHALLFCASIATNRSARAASADVEALRERLVASGRWPPARALELEDDVWACGPARDAALVAAA